MATYTTGGKEIDQLIVKLIREYHQELLKARVTVTCLLAFGTDGPALKFAHWPAAALVKINSLKDRVEGKADATILLDGDRWEERPEDEQRAILDHELQHLEVRRDKDGKVKRDDAGRPKLQLRPHDWQLGGFDVIVDRHRDAALEAQSAKDLSQRLTQKEFSWG